MRYKTSEEFPIDRFRAHLGVDPDKLKEFKNFKLRAIDPAVLEVNGLGEFGCKVEPIYSVRKVTAVRLSWWAKNLDERKNTLHELSFSRIGRRARLQGNVEAISGLQVLPGPGDPSQDVADDPIPRRSRSAPERPYLRAEGQGGTGSRTPHPNLLPSASSRRQGSGTHADVLSKVLPLGETGLTETQLQRFRRDFPGLDIPWLEREFRGWVAERDDPKDYVAAFYGFMKHKQRQQ